MVVALPVSEDMELKNNDIPKVNNKQLHVVFECQVCRGQFMPEVSLYRIASFFFCRARGARGQDARENLTRETCMNLFSRSSGCESPLLP